MTKQYIRWEKKKCT